MSAMETYYVICGMVIEINAIPDFDYYDDKWLPFIEGHPNVGVSMFMSEMEPDRIYVGKVLAQSNELLPKNIDPKAVDILFVSNWIADNLKVQPRVTYMMFKDVR